MSKTSDTFSLGDLCLLADMPQRTVRYYIQNGLVSRPEGANRGAHYTHEHLDQLLTVRKWQRAGLSLERIRELVAEPDESEMLPPPRRRPGDVTVRSHIALRPGVELVIDPGEANLKPEDVRALAREAAALVDQLAKETSE